MPEMSPHFSDLDPFCAQNADNPPTQYWVDQAFWAMYKAAISFAKEEERNRCRRLLQSHLALLPHATRATFTGVLKGIESPRPDER
jgi:hypothetical protein